MSIFLYWSHVPASGRVLISVFFISCHHIDKEHVKGAFSVDFPLTSRDVALVLRHAVRSVVGGTDAVRGMCEKLHFISRVGMNLEGVTGHTPRPLLISYGTRHIIGMNLLVWQVLEEMFWTLKKKEFTSIHVLLNTLQLHVLQFNTSMVPTDIFVISAWISYYRGPRSDSTPGLNMNSWIRTAASLYQFSDIYI